MNKELAHSIATAVETTVVGQQPLFERMLIATLCNGHMLIEGVPGIAKTTAVRAYAAALGLTFARVQFTPDMLPGDLVGTQVFDPRAMSFTLHRGPIIANLLLADEINRAPAKVQSALLEAMQERSITIAGTTERLPDPFVVLATQNPLEHEGTYPLPEAQLDRFMFKVLATYPSRADEARVLDKALAGELEHFPSPVASAADLTAARERLTHVRVDGAVSTYVLDLVDATRHPERHDLTDLRELIEVGVSPRAAIHLTLAARARASLDGRDYTTPDDVQAVLPDVFRHRIGRSFTAEAEAVTVDQLVERLLLRVPVP
jgi:MoxR-like ATPase